MKKTSKKESKSIDCIAEFLFASCLLLDVLQVYIAGYSLVEFMESLRSQRASKTIKYNFDGITSLSTRPWH